MSEVVLRRIALSALLVSVIGCGAAEASRALSGGAPPPQAPPVAAASSLPKRTLPPDDPSLKGCAADWFEGFRSLPPLVDRAGVIVRATTVSSQTTFELWGTGYRTTLRVDRALKGRPTATVTVIESACPVVYGGPGEWLLFLAPKLDEPSVFQIPGGIQGAFPVKAGRIAPIYRDAYLTFPTEAVPARRSEGYWVVGFVLGERYVMFEYHPDTGQLVQRDDGYAVRPDASFGPLIGAP